MTFTAALRTTLTKPRHAWRASDGAQRALYAAGTLLVLSGVIHAGLGWATGDAWAGPVSWRKPALFGISTGVTCWSLGWICGWLNWPRGTRILAPLAAGAAVVEVGLITLQTWRGVASHFNTATVFDAFVNYTIDALITFIALVIALMTWRSIGPLRRDGRSAPRDLALAIRVGLGMLLVSCLFGFWMLWYGSQRVAAGESPEVYGAAGVVKFVHGMPMHAVQVLPLACGLLALLAVAEATRARVVVLLGWGFAAITLFAALQTFGGRARLGVDPLTAVVLGIAALLFISPLGVLFWERRSRVT